MPPRPLKFIPLSEDAEKIRFFGTLMPNLLLLKRSPGRWVAEWFKRRFTPRMEVEAFVRAEADDFASLGDTWLFVHRWHILKFDPLAFARAHTFLARLERLLRRQGYWAEPLDPLSPEINLPRLAAEAGLGNLSPYGLLVHPVFGPRLILSGMRTNYPLALRPRWGGAGCNDCDACLKLCPQRPLESGVVDLGRCQTCALCFTVCPTGKGRQARARWQELARRRS